MRSNDSKFHSVYINTKTSVMIRWIHVAQNSILFILILAGYSSLAKEELTQNSILFILIPVIKRSLK